MSTPPSGSERPPGTPVPVLDRSHAIEFLRIGVGLVWFVNLIFIVDPQNQYFSKFSDTALSFGSTTLGGPGLAQFVAAHATIFSWSIAIVTGYLAFALTLGLTTRLACFIGSFFSAALLVTQVGSTYILPGGTDVGAHPLYILIYAMLVVGGAGSALSLDQRIRSSLAARRGASRPIPKPAPKGWFNVETPRGLLVYFIVGTVLAAGIGAGLVVAVPVNTGTPSGNPSLPTYYENLTVSINPLNGWPQYSPANFTVPTGRVVFTITDQDMPMNWTSCPCLVRGTVRNVEAINGTNVSGVSSINVAHSFVVPDLGITVYSPGQSVVRFTVNIVNPGTFVWICTAPCGAGANPYSTPPMGTAGYMAGTMTVS